jgi:hypothetical protein
MCWYKGRTKDKGQQAKAKRRMGANSKPDKRGKNKKGEPLDSRWVWVPPVGGAPSRHTSTGCAADGVHKYRLGDSGGTGVEWCPDARAARRAARRGDAEQPRRCAGRRAGAHRRGEYSRPFDGVSGSEGGLRLCSGDRSSSSTTGI